MRATLPVLICIALTTTGCSRITESRFNPLNWLNAGPTNPVRENGTLRPLVPENAGEQIVETRSPVARISNLRFERTPTGGILRAQAVTASAGYYNAELVPVSQSGGTVTYQLLAAAPTPADGPRPAAQTLVVATVLSVDQLAGVRKIIVQAAQNSQTLRP